MFQQIKLIFRDNRFDCLLVKMDETFFSWHRFFNCMDFVLKLVSKIYGFWILNKLKRITSRFFATSTKYSIILWKLLFRISSVYCVLQASMLQSSIRLIKVENSSINSICFNNNVTYKFGKEGLECLLRS